MTLHPKSLQAGYTVPVNIGWPKPARFPSSPSYMGVLVKVIERRAGDHALNDAANIGHELKAEIVDFGSCISTTVEK